MSCVEAVAVDSRKENDKEKLDSRRIGILFSTELEGKTYLPRNRKVHIPIKRMRW